MGGACSMRVVHMIDSEGMYGAEYVLYNLLPCLRKIGIDAMLACLSPTGSAGADLGRALGEKAVPVVYLDERKKISFKGLLSIFRVLRSSRADILHVHGYKATILGGMAARIAGVPIISTYHAEAGRYPELSAYVNLETPFLKWANRVIAVSRMIRDELIRRGVSETRLCVIHNGINDPARLSNKDFSHDVETGTPLRVLCIGRLIPVKRFDLAIRAISVLRRDFPNVHLTIAGAGPLHAELQSLAKDLGLGDSVSLPGYISETEELFRKSAVFVLTSETEGSPITLIEAMAYGKPIVATAVGAIPEMTTGNAGAQLIAPCNLEQLIDALRRFIADPAYRRESGKLARKRFESCFTAETMAARYGEQYEACLRGTR